MRQSVHISIVWPSVVVSHAGQQLGLTWSQAEAVYIAGKRLVADAARYDETGVWTESLAEAPIGRVEFRRMGLMVHLLLHGRGWIEAPYAVMRRLLKELYRCAKLIEQDTPAIALQQIDDMAVLYVSAAPLGLSLDHRKIDEALKQTSNGVPPCGIVPPPTLTGGIL